MHPHYATFINRLAKNSPNRTKQCTADNIAIVTTAMVLTSSKILLLRRSAYYS